MTNTTTHAWTEALSRYAAGIPLIRNLADTVPSAALDLSDDGGWSARQVFHHVADGELVGAVRLRKLLSEEMPTIQVYDPDTLSQVGCYDRPIDTAVDVFCAVRSLNVELLYGVLPDALTRRGLHVEYDVYDVARWLEIYATHAEEHAEQIRAAVASAPR